MSNKPLSKSEYMNFLRHPGWLWLKRYDKDKIPPFSAYQLYIFDQGSKFEKYPESRFPEGVRIGFEDFSEYNTMPQRTADAIGSGSKVLFQGAFKADDLICITDVVKFVDGETLDIYEIKSSTKEKKEHIYDLSFQKHVIEKCGYKVRDIYLLYVNNKYVRYGDVDVDKFVAEKKLTEEIEELEKTFFTEENIKKAFEIIELGRSDRPEFGFGGIGLIGSVPEWKEVYANLYEISDTDVHNLTRINKEKLGELEDLGIKSIEDIPVNFELSEPQRKQVNITKTKERVENLGEIKNWINQNVVYPIYFLDYETIGELVPPYDATSPYQNIVFQYSLHVLEESGEMKHYEYLHTSSDRPTEYIVKALKEQIGEKGSVVVWNESFEKRCNDQMCSILLGDSEVEDFLQDLNTRIIDLMIPFRKGFVQDYKFKGSSSIKNVLPVLVPELSYSDLNVKKGDDAQFVWIDTFLHDNPERDKSQTEKDLKEYCKLDTLAMVEIYKYLNTL